jgi:hypothetical protein
MPLYFLVLDADLFHHAIRPALAAGWRQRRFTACQDLCQQFLRQAQTFKERYHLGNDPPLLAGVADGTLPFDRTLWQHLAGELLWFGAADIPEITTSPEGLTYLLADPRTHRVLYGTHDLAFAGGFYRPDRAGWNDTADVAQLADFLAAVRPETWTADALAAMATLDEGDRAEEVEFVRDGFAALVELYRQAAGRRQVIVCEQVE